MCIRDRSTSGSNQAASKLKDPRHGYQHSVHMNTITGATTYNVVPDNSRPSRTQNNLISAERSLTALSKKYPIQTPAKIEPHKSQHHAEPLLVKGVELLAQREFQPTMTVVPLVAKPKGNPQV